MPAQPPTENLYLVINGGYRDGGGSKFYRGHDTLAVAIANKTVFLDGNAQVALCKLVREDVTDLVKAAYEEAGGDAVRSETVTGSREESAGNGIVGHQVQMRIYKALEPLKRNIARNLRRVMP